MVGIIAKREYLQEYLRLNYNPTKIGENACPLASFIFDIENTVDACSSTRSKNDGK